VTLRNGGIVTLVHAPQQRVTLLEGNTEYSKATIAEGDRLVIDRCAGDCPDGCKLEVEIRTPDIDGIMVIDGGVIQSRGSFPRQSEIRAAVEDGGVIDLRSMTADLVAASVHDGGRILTKPRETLVAKVTHGGVVTYWGKPRVTRAIEKGGVVTRGEPADADKPLRELGPAMRDVTPPMPPVAPVPPAPPLPPSPPTGSRGSSDT
jgi:hypothetical protein